VDVLTPTLQAIVEGMMRTLAKAGDVGLSGHNVVAMRGGTMAAESTKHKGLQVGLTSLELKS
jgi:hypothetical protein